MAARFFGQDLALGGDTGPIFILTPPGLPGQTLAAALAQGGAAYDVPEMNFMLAESVSGMMRDLIGIRAVQMHGTLRALAQLLAGEVGYQSVDMARRWLMRRRHQTVENAFDEILALVHPRRLVMPITAPLFERPPRTRLARAYPAARYVNLVAHPHFYARHVSVETLGQVSMQLAGAMDASQRPAEPDPQALWLLVEQAAEDLQAQLGDNRFVECRTEDFLSAPETTLARLAGELGLPADGPALERMLHPELSVYAGPGPMGASVQGAIQSLDEMRRSLPDPSASTLGGAMPGRLDGQGFSAEAIARATAHGYPAPSAPDDAASADPDGDAGRA